ncbi:MAG TPA: uracil-DNA glycosylase family protein [Steroidobacteraceae bacterium]|nr:uracil-DNA glycosylase family protein [Steroidobacteraceae bacterium]
MIVNGSAEAPARARRGAAHADPGLVRLLEAVRACRVCARDLPLGPRPLLQVGAGARILIVGQAPGRRAHASGIPWGDPSGERLRAWMGISTELFYDASSVAIIPMGYCYPGRDRHGDRPPRRECAELWLAHLLAELPRVELTLLVGSHAQHHFLAGRSKRSLTVTVRAWREYAPRYLPLPHPSPRNQPWLARNVWFEQELLPTLRERVAALTSRLRRRGAHGPPA